MNHPAAVSKFLLLLLLFTCSVLSSQGQKYVLVWSDEFNQPGLPDTTRWSYETGKLRNNELQYYTQARSENARIEDSVLIIEARKENYLGAEYTSASIISRGTGDWRYGKIEISAKVPLGKGSWPALWMMPTNNEYGGWPKSGEIDIMEYIGVEPHNLYFTSHFEGITGSGHEASGKKVTALPQPYNQFIRFSLVWTPEKMEWHANDVKYHEYKKNSDDPRVWPFDKEFYLILNLAWGGNWGGYAGVDDSKLPLKFIIDYVRVYQMQETEGPFSLNLNAGAGGIVQVEPDLESYPEGTEVTLRAYPEKGYYFDSWKYYSRSNPYTFVINKNTDITGLFKRQGELVGNSEFNENMFPWNIYEFNGDLTDYTTSIEDGVFVMHILKSSGTDWHLGFQQNGFPMKKGKHKLTFDAWADVSKPLLVTISKNYVDWGSIVTRIVGIGKTKTSFEVDIDMPHDDNNVRLFFGTGKFTGNFYIDNISLISESQFPVYASLKENGNPFIQVYPNPSPGEFTVDFQQTNQFNTLIELYHISGECVYRQRFYDSKAKISAGDLQKGVYIMKVSNKTYIETRPILIR